MEEGGKNELWPLQHVFSPHSEVHTYLLKIGSQSLINRNRRKEGKGFRSVYITLHPEDNKSGIWAAEEGEGLFCVPLLLSSDWND